MGSCFNISITFPNVSMTILIVLVSIVGLDKHSNLYSYSCYGEEFCQQTENCVYHTNALFI